MWYLFYILILFILGIYFYGIYGNKALVEGLTNNNGLVRCPNILIQKDSKFYLYNSKVAKVPGVNPIEFENLEEYTEFMEWQRSQGIRCPVLYLQNTYDAQGETVYKVRPSISEPQGGLPPTVPYLNSDTNTNSNSYLNPNPTLLVDSNRNDPPYNKESVPGYDPTSYYVGTTTPLDAMDEREQGLLYSPNAMDDNWGGASYTQSLVDSGAYAGNEVKLRV